MSAACRGAPALTSQQRGRGLHDQETNTSSRDSGLHGGVHDRRRWRGQCVDGCRTTEDGELHGRVTEFNGLVVGRDGGLRDRPDRRNLHRARLQRGSEGGCTERTGFISDELRHLTCSPPCSIGAEFIADDLIKIRTAHETAAPRRDEIDTTIRMYMAQQYGVDDKVLFEQVDLNGPSVDSMFVDVGAAHRQT